MNRNFAKREKGQSLVEVALFFPIFLIILAGVVEVSQLIITKNRITEAARTSARFGANGGENAGITTVALNTITQTLNTNPEQWDIWAVRGTINSNGNGFVPNTWEFEHTYGLAHTQAFSDVVESDIQIDVLEQLQQNESGQTVVSSAADLRFVGIYIQHDVESILGLNAIENLTGFNSVHDLAIMRFIGVDQVVTGGCDVFPIAVHEGIRSVTAPGVGVNPYPDLSDFHNSSPKPAYEQFIYNSKPGDVPLADATEGDIFKIQNGSSSGNFGWLKWNVGLNGNSPNLIASLAWPGNSTNYDPPCNLQTPACQSTGVNGEEFWGYAEPDDPTDRELHVNDWVAGATGNMNSDGVRDIINEHINQGRTLRLPIWNNSQGTGSNVQYQVARFAIFRLHGHNITSNNSWILAEFIRFDNSCGQQ